MAINIDYGQQGNLIPFNCYRAKKNERGRLIKEESPYDRVYCVVENSTTSRQNINNSVRAIGTIATIKTNSENDLQEDYYIENVYTSEMWKIDSITVNPINNASYEGSVRPLLETVMGCSR